MNDKPFPVHSPTFDDEHTRWQAVQDRDPNADGAFVVAVESTGIYCRPSCPSRRPRRENVRFFAEPVLAERAGFRPCKRCRPRETHQHIELARRACRMIDGHPDGIPTLAELGAELAVSPHHLQRTFKRVMGISPRQYAEARRLERLKSGLREREDVTGTIYDAGFGSSSRLYEQAHDQLGMTPRTYQRGGKNMSIRYAIVDSPLGRLLVGTTDRGVCAVSLGSDDEHLEAELAAEYPAASIARDDTITPWITTILDHLEGRSYRLDLPLDIQATAFQRQVWQELRAIPYGETRSYGEVAEAVGSPNAVRAVAGACAANPAALVIPCHRVVRSDGTTGGYRWGADRKTALLEREQAPRVSEVTTS